MGDNINKDEELEELVIDIPENLELTLRPETCIYRVRPSIRKMNEATYTPQLVSIGPFHRDKPDLQNMEIQKLRYLKLFCERVKGMTEKQVVNHLSCIIKECEEKIRHCYEEHCSLNSSEFVKMILLDAVFIIEFSLRMDDAEAYTDDFILGQRSTTVITLLDLSLIENQLPYFIIKRLYTETPFDKSREFDALICCLYAVNLSDENLHCLEKVNHFVDLSRYEILDRTQQNLVAGEYYGKLKYSASKLRKAGVKFEAVKYDSGDLRLDIKFINGVLKIPMLQVVDFSELVYRNVMVLEQRHYPNETYVCNYFFLLDHLINTGEDVDLLVDAGIILHWLGSNELFAEFINKLCQGMVDYGSCYGSLYKQLNEHYENQWNHRKATLKLVYFSNLWRGTGTVAAGVLLLLTLLQTISSAKSL